MTAVYEFEGVKPGKGHISVQMDAGPNFLITGSFFDIDTLKEYKINQNGKVKLPPKTFKHYLCYVTATRITGPQLKPKVTTHISQSSTDLGAIFPSNISNPFRIKAYIGDVDGPVFKMRYPDIVFW